MVSSLLEGELFEGFVVLEFVCQDLKSVVSYNSAVKFKNIFVSVNGLNYADKPIIAKVDVLKVDFVHGVGRICDESSTDVDASFASKLVLFETKFGNVACAWLLNSFSKVKGGKVSKIISLKLKFSNEGVIFTESFWKTGDIFISKFLVLFTSIIKVRNFTTRCL